ACACGMLSKESMATAPLMVVLYDLAFGSGTVSQTIRRRRWLYAGLSLTWIITIVILLSNPRGRSAGLTSDVSPWLYLLNQPRLIVRYLWLSVWPSSLVLDYGLPRSIGVPEALPYGLAVCGLLAASLLMWRVSRPIGFLGAWFFITLAPASSVIPVMSEVGAE